MGCGGAKGLRLNPVLEALVEREKSILAEGSEQVLWKDLTLIGPLQYTEEYHVSLMESQEKGKTFAGKMVSKGFVVNQGRQQEVAQEREVWRKMGSDFVVRLYETYSLEQNLCFLMEPVLADNLYNIYEKNNLFGSAPLCRFYAAGVALALAHVHAMDCIHRDVKPESVYLTEAGRVKLGDFGCSKALAPYMRTYTLIGTPDYFAPEIVQQKGHNRAVDWWSLGVFVFDLMSGEPPFTAANNWKIMQNISKGISKVKFPKACQGDVKTLVEALLKPLPGQRAPMLPGGVKNIMAHRYFREFDWSAMADLSMEPPWKPDIDSALAVIDEQQDLASQFPHKEIPWLDEVFNSRDSTRSIGNPYILGGEPV